MASKCTARPPSPLSGQREAGPVRRSADDARSSNQYCQDCNLVDFWLIDDLSWLCTDFFGFTSARRRSSIRLEKLARDEESRQGGSQAMYLDEEGWFGVQGLLVDADTLANVENLVPGEGVVRIKPEIVIEAVRRYQAR